LILCPGDNLLLISTVTINILNTLNIQLFFPCVIDNTTIYKNIFHRILTVEGKISTLGGEDAGGTGEQKTPSPEELSQLVRELIAAVPWGHHANVLAKLTDPAARLYYLQATARFGGRSQSRWFLR